MTRHEFREAVEDILGVPRGRLRDSDSRSTVEGWSSVADVQIVAYLASESATEPDAELMEAETFGDIMRILDQKRAFGS